MSNCTADRYSRSPWPRAVGAPLRAIAGLVLVAAFAARPANALNFFELEAYPATTEGMGLHEFESLTTFVPQGRKPTEEERAGEAPRRHRLLRTTLEYNYGLTDKVDAAAYLDVRRENGAEAELAQVRARLRGALFDKGRFPLDLGWYVEAEMPVDAESDLELEIRPIVSRDIGRFSLDLNPIFELPVVSEERRTLEFNYAARLYYRLSPRLVPGVEFFGDIGQIRAADPSRDQQHFIFAALYAEIAPGLKFAAGPGFGLTRASDPVILKFQIEYEFTLGTGWRLSPW